MKLTYTRFSLFSFMAENIRHKNFFKINIFNSIFLMLKGFSRGRISLYSLNIKNYKKYLPDSILHKVTLNTNNGYWPVLHDKYVFYRFIKDKLPTGELLGLVFDGKITGVDGVFGYDELIEGLKKSRKYVLKPLQSGDSDGILFLSSDFENIRLQDEPINAEKLRSIIDKLDKYGIFKFYHQHDSFAKIYPGSVNTIRIVTLYDFKQKEPFIFASILRMGWSGTKPFHTFGKGGLVSLIDEETGALSVCKRTDATRKIENISVHPDTNQMIEGMVVPFWDSIKSTILQYLTDHPIFNYVGWDILVTNESFIVLEANHNPGIGYVQTLKPFLTDPRAALFFKKLNIYKN